MMKVNVRMNLFHFLNKPYEKDVIDKLSVISADSIVFYLRLWYKDGTVSTKDLKKFLLEYESSLHFKTNIRVDNNLKPGDFVWFNIVDNDNAGKLDRVRFEYIYYNKEQILKGLDEFHKCAKFSTSEKPSKIQKRNDYESSNRRK